MGHYATAYWESDPLAPTMGDRASGAYHPFVPDTLAASRIELTAEAASGCERAAVALTELDAHARYTSVAESLARILLRSEAISSSRIEGLEMNARRLLELEALDELGVSHRSDSVEAEVMGSIHAMRDGVERAALKPRIEIDDILAMHHALLEHTRLAEYGGVLRQTQNWIGGSWYNPLRAAYVPPQPDCVPALVDDLMAFVNDSSLPKVAIAAIAHAQMVTIHPFVDGNGRISRALGHVALRRAGLCARSIAPVSLVLATSKEQYIRALTSYRYDQDEQQDTSLSLCASGWVEFFCAAVVDACARALEFEGRIERLRSQWQDTLRPRAGSATELLLDALPGNPVVSIESVKRLTERSYPAARGAVRALEEAGILVQSSKNRKSGLYVAMDVLDEFTRYERSLATVSGDTRSERPKRNVPQRV